MPDVTVKEQNKVINTGRCPGCERTYDELDKVLTAAVNYEVEVTGASKAQATLHVLASVCSWWLDRTLKQPWKSRQRGIDAGIMCVANVFREQGTEL